ncbi:unnamed protein product [Hymenolepis diminuta]|uniref:Uncharacterized protein n=1 Tax=Hymenolepis diminuta TaxID=6216 RepID=A0A564Y609_HYMDI|nr:unnamed protein product [Hymenolepis diminuta]
MRCAVLTERYTTRIGASRPWKFCYSGSSTEGPYSGITLLINTIKNSSFEFKDWRP